MIRILFVLPSLKAGGAEIFISNLIRKISQKKNCEVILFLTGGIRSAFGKKLADDLINSEIKIFGVNIRRSISITNVKLINDICEKNKPNIVFTNLIQSDILILLYRVYTLFKSKKKCRYVRRIANSKNTYLIDIFSYYVTPIFIRNTIYCSHAILDNNKLKKFANILLMPKSFVIYNGLPKCKINNLQIINANYPVFRSVRKFFCVGRFEGKTLANMQKGFLTVLKAVKIVKTKGVNFKLVIYGEGPLKNEILNHIKLNKLEKEIEIKKPIPIENILKNNECLILSSLHEGLSNVALESIFSNRLLILNDIPENRCLPQNKSRIYFFDGTPDMLAKQMIYIARLDHKTNHEGYSKSDLRRYELNRSSEEYINTFKKVINW